MTTQALVALAEKINNMTDKYEIADELAELYFAAKQEGMTIIKEIYEKK